MADDLGGATPAAVAPASAAAEPTPQRLSALSRRIVSVLLVLHLVAIVIAPLTVGPTSPLYDAAWQVFRPYLELLYLNHGYHYFAPDPGPISTLVAYTLEFEDGSTRQGTLPNRGIKPRLLYHRHFMLTEWLASAPDDERTAWHRSYARHLCRSTGAASVSLSRMTREVPNMAAVRNGATLTDPIRYLETPLPSWRRDEF